MNNSLVKQYIDDQPVKVVTKLEMCIRDRTLPIKEKEIPMLISIRFSVMGWILRFGIRLKKPQQQTIRSTKTSISYAPSTVCRISFGN